VQTYTDGPCGAFEPLVSGQAMPRQVPTGRLIRRRVRQHGSDPFAARRSSDLVDHLIAEQLSQPVRGRRCKNVTDMLGLIGLSARAHAYRLVSTLTPESFRA
jgi:hypothetical protein